MIVDAHLHVWDRTRARYDWLGPHLPEVDRTIGFDEIVPTLERRGVGGVVLVQSADEPGDTTNLFEVAEREPLVLGVVAWVPLERPEEAADLLATAQEHPKLVGIRNLIHDRADPEWALRPEFDRGLDLLEQRGVPFDFVTSDAHALPVLIQVAERHPGLTVVLDHLGKPSLREGASMRRFWERSIAEVAHLPNVVAKLSGLYAEGDSPAEWTTEQVARVAATAIGAFGSERVMYGGDWPMSLTAGGYDRVLDSMLASLAGLTDGQRDDVLWRTATRTYGLPTPSEGSGAPTSAGAEQAPR